MPYCRPSHHIEAVIKLNYRKTFPIGLGFSGISVLRTLYNAYVPIYLQAGSPTFEALGEVGFRPRRNGARRSSRDWRSSACCLL